jgi:hypothetical protein
MIQGLNAWRLIKNNGFKKEENASNYASKTPMKFILLSKECFLVIISVFWKFFDTFLYVG